MQFRVCACSQFNGTLEWLKTRLTEEGFGFRTSASPALHPQPIWGTADARLHAVNGSMPLKQRAKAIDAFQNDPPTTVCSNAILYARSLRILTRLCFNSQVFLLSSALCMHLVASLRAASDAPPCRSAFRRGRHHADVSFARLPHGARHEPGA